MTEDDEESDTLFAHCSRRGRIGNGLETPAAHRLKRMPNHENKGVTAKNLLTDFRICYTISV